ncbi:MAG: 50S ribosomal protein L13 [Mycoplasmatales bacterium]
MKNTYMANAQNVKKEWLIIDATDQTVGRLSAEVAHILRGKHKPTFTPHVDCGDNVIIINAEKVKFTGNKLEDKIYYRHTNHPGGLKQETAKEVLDKHPERILERSIKGMLPKTKLGSQMYRNLHIYVGADHKHTAQNPTEYKLKG